MLLIEPGRGNAELSQYAAKLPPFLREEFYDNVDFYQRSYSAHFLTRDEFVLRLECAVAEIRLQQQERSR